MTARVLRYAAGMKKQLQEVGDDVFDSDILAHAAAHDVVR